MSQYIIPVIGSRGYYEFLPPFDTIAGAHVEYRCNAVRRISEYLGNNEDPYEIAYQPYKIDESIYDEDKAEDAYIAVLQSGKGHWLHVPYRFIKSYPSGDGIQVCSRAIVFSLPSIPLSLDLSILKADIATLIKGTLGVDCAHKEVMQSQVVLVTAEVHEAMAAERAVHQTIETMFSRTARLERENASLRQKLGALEALVKTLQP